MDFSKPAEHEITKVMSARDVGADVRERIAALLRGFLESSLAEDIRNAEKVDREVSFTLYAGGIPIHDRVDLIHTLGRRNLAHR